jgi:hypothetical protein
MSGTQSSWTGYVPWASTGSSLFNPFPSGAAPATEQTGSPKYGSMDAPRDVGMERAHDAGWNSHGPPTGPLPGRQSMEKDRNFRYPPSK